MASAPMAMMMMIISVLSSLVGRSAGSMKPGPWKMAHATFYGDDTAQETMGGACGYGNLWQTGYGVQTTALSTALFNDGYACGQCFQIRCSGSKWCYSGSPITTITATNLCPPNWAEPSDDGGWCNPPRQHFDMSKPAFEKIAVSEAGIVPVDYRRVACPVSGGIKLLLDGNAWWLLVYVMNAGGPGDVAAMWVKGTYTGWLAMSHNWGASYQVFQSLQGQPLSFRITSLTTRQTLVASNVAPADWQFGSTYQANVNFH